MDDWLNIAAAIGDTLKGSGKNTLEKAVRLIGIMEFMSTGLCADIHDLSVCRSDHSLAFVYHDDRSVCNDLVIHTSIGTARTYTFISALKQYIRTHGVRLKNLPPLFVHNAGDSACKCSDDSHRNCPDLPLYFLASLYRKTMNYSIIPHCQKVKKQV